MPESLRSRPGDSSLAPDAADILSIDLHWGRTTQGAPSLHLVVVGDLDCVGAPLLQEAWTAEVADLPFDVVVDLGQVQFCNAAGLRVVATILDSAVRSRRVRLSVRPGVARLLALFTDQVGSGVEMIVVPQGRLGRSDDLDGGSVVRGDVARKQPVIPGVDHPADHRGDGRRVIALAGDPGVCTEVDQGPSLRRPGRPAA